VGHGETVIDVPATLTARTRRLSGHSGRKTDEHDARLVAIAAGGDRRLRRVEPEDFSVVLGAARRSALASGVSSAQHDLSAACVARWTASQEAPSWVCRSLEAAKLLRSLHPVNVVDAERKQIARELVDWRWLHRRILAVTRGIRDALMAHGVHADPGLWHR
jgi:transposase